MIQMTNLGLCLDFKHSVVGYPNATGLETKKTVKVIHRFLRHGSVKCKKNRGVPGGKLRELPRK